MAEAAGPAKESGAEEQSQVGRLGPARFEAADPVGCFGMLIIVVEYDVEY